MAPSIRCFFPLRHAARNNSVIHGGASVVNDHISDCRWFNSIGSIEIGCELEGSEGSSTSFVVRTASDGFRPPPLRTPLGREGPLRSAKGIKVAHRVDGHTY